jgi:hypothetical protein
MTPKLSVSIDKPRPRPDGHGYFARLKATNLRHDSQLTDCFANLLEVRVVLGRDVNPPEEGQGLCWSSRGVGSGQLKAAIGPTASAFLDVAFTDLERGRDLFFFTFRDPFSFAMPFGTYDLFIEVGAEVGEPVRDWYRLVAQGMFDLKLESLDEERPKNRALPVGQAD